MVMSRLSDRQYGASAGNPYFAGVGGGVQAQASFGANVGAGGSAQATGVVLLIVLALVLLGHHGLKG